MAVGSTPFPEVQAGVILTKVENQDATAHGRIARHGGLLSASAGIVGVLSYTCTLLMTNALSPGDFSQFAAAQMLLGMVGIITSALVPLPLSHAVGANPPGSEGRRDAMAFAALISVIAGFAAALVTGAVTAGFGSPATAAIVALSSFVLFMGAAPSGWFQGELRFVRYTLKSLGEISTRLLFSLLVVAFAWGAPGAVLGFAMGGLALLVTPRSFLRDLTWRPRVLLQKWRWAETADIALTLCIVSVLVGVDVVIVAFLDGGSAATAGFQALASIAKAPVYVAAGTVIVMFPLLRRPGVQVEAVLRAGLGSFARLALFSCAVIATAPPALVALVLPSRYHGSLVLLPWLALSGLGYAALTVLVTVLLGLRAYRRCQLGLLLASGLILGGLIAGWQADGVRGLAIGCAVGATLAAIALLGIAHGILPDGSGRETAAGLAKATVLVLVFWLTAQQPILWLLAVIPAGLLVLGQLRDRTNASVKVDAPGVFRGATEAFSHSWLHGIGRYQAMTRRLNRGALKAFGAFLLCAAAAFGVRAIGLTRGFELWVDEMLYGLLGRSVSEGNILPWLPDGPFHLHPPGFFWLEGAILNVTGAAANNVDLVMQLRWLNAVLGAVTVGLAFLIARAVANNTAAWMSAAVLSFEPFVLRSNSHLFLETLAMTAVAGGLLIVVRQFSREWSRSRAVLLGIAGLLMGYGILSKDFFALCTLVPMVAAVFWRHTLRWRDSAITVGAMIVPYLIYMVIVIAHGMLPDWIRAKGGGLLRLLGVEKTTGFTADGSPDLVSRLIDNAEHFGSSYILLGLCPVAAALLCFSVRQDRRLLGLVGLTLGAYGMYSAAFGTFEEQYGYGVMIAGVLSAAALGSEIVERRPQLRTSVSVAAVVLVLLASAQGLRLETSTDNGFVQARQWVQDHLPREAKVAVTNSTGELAFADDERFGVWPSAPLMLEQGANYILTQSLPTSQGYGYVAPAMLPWLEANATPLFRSQGLTNGETTLWFVDPAALETGARLGVGTPSSDYETAE